VISIIGWVMFSCFLVHECLFYFKFTSSSMMGRFRVLRGDLRYWFFILRYLLRGIASGMFGSIKYLYLSYVGLGEVVIGVIASFISVASSIGKVVAGFFPPKRRFLTISLVCFIVALSYFLLVFSPVVFVPVLLIIVSLLYGVEYVCSSSLMMSFFEDRFTMVYSALMTLWSLSSSASTLVAGFMIGRYGFQLILLSIFFVFLLLSGVAYYFRRIDLFLEGVGGGEIVASSFYDKLRFALSYRPYVFYEFSTLSLSLAVSMSIPYVYLFLLRLSNSYEVVAILASIYPVLNLIITAVQPLIGRLAERFGSHRVLALSFTFFSLYHLALSLISDAFQYLFCLVFLSLAIPLNNISIMGFLNDILRNKEKDLFLGVSSSLASLPSMVGPVIGGLIAEVLGVRGVFMASALTCITSIVPLFMARRLNDLVNSHIDVIS